MDAFNKLSNKEFPRSLKYLPVGVYEVKYLAWWDSKKYGMKIKVLLDDDIEYNLTPRTIDYLKTNNDLFIKYNELANNGKLRLQFYGGKLSNFNFIEKIDNTSN